MYGGRFSACRCAFRRCTSEVLPVPAMPMTWAGEAGGWRRGQGEQSCLRQFSFSVLQR